MTFICSLPADYNNFVSSLLLVDSLDVDKLKAAFLNEENQRASRQITSHNISFYTQSSASNSGCFFCGGPNHFEKDCHKKKKASEQAKRNRGKGQKGKEAQSSKEAKDESPEAGNSAVIESAGHASVLSSSDFAKWQQTQASTHWNTDTGASSHMTPHPH